jgi:hypothetical protein
LQQAREVREATKGFSDYTEGAAKSRWPPVAFWLHSILPAECNYTVGDQEMLTIVLFCRHWQHYLECAKYLMDILIDYYSL